TCGDLFRLAVGEPLPPDMEAPRAVRREIHPRAIRRPGSRCALSIGADLPAGRLPIERDEAAWLPCRLVHFHNQNPFAVWRRVRTMSHGPFGLRRVDRTD